MDTSASEFFCPSTINQKIEVWLNQTNGEAISNLRQFSDKINPYKKKEVPCASGC
ncbi:hypothetical protein NG791_25355 [Laspinema sp. D1]|uniref:hypothetical protein n=1 Tax=Laspinema palackyanum TaxID=3231601 RepID=UPI003488951D|nr:hypothetical protein [Laspinema sp. D2b]